MPRMMTTARLTLSLLGLSLMPPRLAIAAPLITHRLSPMQADVIPFQTGRDASHTWYQSWNVARASALRLGMTPAQGTDPSPVEPGISLPAAQPSAVSQSDGPNAVEDPGSSASVNGTSLTSPGNVVAANATSQAQVIEAAGSGRIGAAPISPVGVQSPPGVVGQRVIDSTGRASVSPAPFTAPAVAPAKQTPQTSSDAANAPGSGTSSSGKGPSDPSTGTQPAGQPVTPGASPTPSTNAAQMLAGPAPGSASSSGSPSSTNAMPAATGSVTSPATGSASASASTAPSGSTAPGTSQISNPGAPPTSTSALPSTLAGSTTSPTGAGTAVAIIDGSGLVNPVGGSTVGASLSSGHATPLSLVSLASTPENTLVNGGAGGVASSDPVSTISAINALSVAPNPLNPGSVSTPASALLPVPPVELTGLVLAPSPPDSTSTDALFGPLPANIPEPSVLDMMGILALGFGVRYMFRSATGNRL